MTAADRIRRVRETLVVLSELATGGEMRRLDVWNAVTARIPLDADEQQLDARRRVKGSVDWAFASTDLAKAGWLVKSGKGEWHVTEAGRDALLQFQDAEGFVAEARARYAAWSKAQKADRVRLLSTVILPDNSDRERLHEVLRLFVTRGLEAGESVFVPSRAVWTAESAAELVQCFIQAPDAEGGSFIEKLQGQLKHASEDARLLMAELVTWQLLPISTDTIGAEKKRRRVEDVLATMEHPVQIPDAVADVFDTGSFAPGARMSSNLYAAMSIIVRLVADWFALTDEQRESALGDPWLWREFVRGIEGELFPTQRNSLLYEVRPDYFGRVVASEPKQRIRDTFIGEIEHPVDDLERDLYAITIALQLKAGGPVNFYDEKYRKAWQKGESAATNLEPHDPDLVTLPGGRVPFPPATSAFATSLHVDEPWLQRTLDLLERRRQVILYGPPGTGKTYLARALAAHIAGEIEVETTKLVQFHPSYSYEDFFEGYRPVTVDGALSYELVGGPMRRIAERARANPELNFVLIIDEINRGNLAKIFGELYFLLEYREQSVELLYSKDASFTLPPNVYIIGTMNTSDRSVALMDAAMRRRFAFVQLHPSLPPTSGVLRAWLRSNELDDAPARLLEALNSRIPDPAFQVGPSYLMNSDLDLSEARLQEVWDFEVLPLLEELHFGEEVDIQAKYGLVALRRSMAKATELAAQEEFGVLESGAP